MKKTIFVVFVIVLLFVCSSCKEKNSFDEITGSDILVKTSSQIAKADEETVTSQIVSSDKTTFSNYNNINVSSKNCVNISSIINKEQEDSHIHIYNSKVKNSTCTEQGYVSYFCECGYSYIAEYIELREHIYLGQVCTNCGKTNEKYELYQEELKQLTDKYNLEVAALQENMNEVYAEIEEKEQSSKKINGQLQSLSPTCPQYYIQQYVNNWQQFGNTYAATQAAKNSWTQQYNSQKKQLENALRENNVAVTNLQVDVEKYTVLLEHLTTEFEEDKLNLKIKYGM